jgi:hypothetical protein
MAHRAEAATHDLGAFGILLGRRRQKHLHDDPFADYPCTNGTVIVPTSVGCGASLDMAKAAASVSVFA